MNGSGGPVLWFVKGRGTSIRSGPLPQSNTVHRTDDFEGSTRNFERKVSRNRPTNSCVFSGDSGNTTVSWFPQRPDFLGPQGPLIHLKRRWEQPVDVSSLYTRSLLVNTTLQWQVMSSTVMGFILNITKEDVLPSVHEPHLPVLYLIKYPHYV